jgi:SAM-dependent methyltransferase
MERDLYAEPQHVTSPDECYFYHSMDVPGAVITVDNGWDLRPNVDRYIGDVSLPGKRVLEIGPASGFLTFHMESNGAEVVSVELAPDADWDIVPHVLIDMEKTVQERRAIMAQLRNGFWFAHERIGSSALVHYGTAYDLPDGLGRFDIAVMASVLLHTRDPLQVIEGCARHADTLVVTEMRFPELEGSPVARLYPTPASSQWDTWWSFSPDMLVQYLGVLGFSECVVTDHEQMHVYPGGHSQMPMFTIVASRS